MYCGVTVCRQWVKFGYSDDVTDESKGRPKKHISDGWGIQMTRPGMALDDENRINASLKKKFERMPNTREVYRLDRELIEFAIDLGAPLPEDPFSLLKPK